MPLAEVDDVRPLARDQREQARAERDLLDPEGLPAPGPRERPSSRRVALDGRDRALALPCRAASLDQRDIELLRAPERLEAFAGKGLETTVDMIEARAGQQDAQPTRGRSGHGRRRYLLWHAWRRCQRSRIPPPRWKQSGSAATASRCAPGRHGAR